MDPAERKEILVLVKTTPVPSKKYGEIVCTAGILSTGEWVRVFPVPFRRMEKKSQFKKYQWITCHVYKAERDIRPESYHVDLWHEIELGDFVDTTDSWENRRRLILDNVKPKVYTSLEELKLDGLANRVTLAVFKPSRVRFHNVKVAERRDPNVVRAALSAMLAPDLFENNMVSADFRLCEETPFDFKYEVVDDQGVKADWTILDWEISTLFYKQKKAHGGDIEEARADVERKYTGFLSPETDLHLYVGTMYKFQQMKAKNPWSIIGVAPFKKIGGRQQTFDLF